MGDTAAKQRQAVLNAALEEFLARGIDEFSVERVAARVGLASSDIEPMWRDRRVLLIDTLVSLGREQLPTPDTGTLRGDLRALAESLAQVPEHPMKRAWFQRVLASGRDVDFSEIRSDYWKIRIADMAPIFRRAHRRGELRAGVDPAESVRMFIAACLFNAIFTDSSFGEDYIDKLIDVFVHGVGR